MSPDEMLKLIDQTLISKFGIEPNNIQAGDITELINLLSIKRGILERKRTYPML